MKEKIVLITGASSGIGKACAEIFAKNGANLILCSRNINSVEFEELSLKYNVKIVTEKLDVRDEESVKNLLNKVNDAFGKIDILINNAGIQRRFPFTEFPEAEWDNVIEVNQKGVFLVSQQVAKYMMGRRAGKIINICSMQSELGRKTITPYAASKGAVKMLTRGMCVELAEYNIQVNGIAPGYFATDMTAALVNDEAFSAWLYQRTPAARWGKPEELIGAAVYLASSAANFVNGHLLFVDGGMLAAV